MTGRLSIRRAACFVVLSATLAAAQSAPRPAPPPDLDQWVSQRIRRPFVTFALAPDGSVEQAKTRAVSPATDFSFDFQDLLLKPARPSHGRSRSPSA